MASKNIEFRVGILIIGALIIFVGSIIWIQGYRFNKDNYRFNVIFDEVGSLAKGDPVMVSGIRMGRVLDLGLIDEGVEVELVVSNQVVLKEDATFTVKNIGLMGERFMAVNAGKSEKRIDLSKKIYGNYDTGIPEMMGMMGEMTNELRNLVLAIRSSVASDQNLEKLAATVENFEDVSKTLADYLHRNRNNFDNAAVDFMKAAKALEGLVSRNAERIDSSLIRGDRISGRIDSMTANLEAMSSSAKQFADRLNNGNGTLQLLVDDRRLYDDLRKTADNLDELIVDIKENPKKYFNLKLSLF
ncbi:MAG: MlaD family protein [Candidatus Zixiibacteriota bacterium]